MALISVIVPVYKVEKYLDKCIESILEQTFKDFELILVDDGSPDQSGEICEKYAAGDSRIHVLHQENGGVSAARNAGIDWAWTHSSSEWIAFIDSDDWVHEKYLETLYNAVKITGCMVSCVSYVETKDRSWKLEQKDAPCEVWKAEEYYLQYNLLSGIVWGKLFAKEAFREIRYPLRKLHEDEFTIPKVLFMYDKVAVVNIPVYAYYVNMEGITRSPWNPKRLEQLEALEERIQYFSEHGKERLKVHTVKIYLHVIKKQIFQVAQTGRADFQKYQLKLCLEILKCILKYPKSVTMLLIKKMK